MAGDGLGTRTVTQVAFVVPQIERSAEACAALFALPLPEIHDPNPADTVARGLTYQGQPLGGVFNQRLEVFFVSPGVLRHLGHGRPHQQPHPEEHEAAEQNRADDRQ